VAHPFPLPPTGAGGPFKPSVGLSGVVSRVWVDSASQVRASGLPARSSARCVRGRRCLASSLRDLPEIAGWRAWRSSSCSAPFPLPTAPGGTPATAPIEFPTSHAPCILRRGGASFPPCFPRQTFITHGVPHPSPFRGGCVLMQHRTWRSADGP
jgi:hypothetical protein